MCSNGFGILEFLSILNSNEYVSSWIPKYISCNRMMLFYKEIVDEGCDCHLLTVLVNVSIAVKR